MFTDAAVDDDDADVEFLDAPAAALSRVLPAVASRRHEEDTAISAAVANIAAPILDEGKLIVVDLRDSNSCWVLNKIVSQLRDDDDEASI